MAAIDDLKTLGRTRLSFADAAEIDEFVRVLEQFERGVLTPDQWRAFRLVRGTYGQRQPGDVQMLRVKIPQGILSAPQLHALAEVGERYSRGFGHITTRQNLQFHFVRLHDVELAMRVLAEAGLTTREACGNSVRNITGCPYAGVSPDEPFDVTPYAEAMTRYLLRHPLSSSLPRKFKIAFEGCTEDHALTAINDIGWRARLDATGRRGFHVRVAGGTSILPVSGYQLFEFLPAAEILNVAEAVLRVFHRLGDYQHKQRNRMKFLIRALGWERWRAELGETLAEVRREGGARLPFDPERPPVEEAPGWRQPSIGGPAGAEPDAQDPAYLEWRRTNVRPQKQADFAIVTATVPLGDLTSPQMHALASLTCEFGDGTLRITPAQDLLFRWVPAEYVRALYERLADVGLAADGADTVADVTSCPGAESCRLAITQSRGLGRLLESHVRGNPRLAAAAAGASIKISGCPNGCGHHHIASLGFQGSVRKLGNRAVPQYFVLVGGGVSAAGARFGRLAAKIPARRLPEAIDRLIDLYVKDRHDQETASAYFGRVDAGRVKAALSDLERLSLADAVPADFVDLGEEQAFAPEVQEGECSA